MASEIKRWPVHRGVEGGEEADAEAGS